ncbi:MAG: DUF2380 domain-containing protein, partial [Rhodospirillales bacterium]
ILEILARDPVAPTPGQAPAPFPPPLGLGPWGGAWPGEAGNLPGAYPPWPGYHEPTWPSVPSASLDWHPAGFWPQPLPLPTPGPPAGTATEFDPAGRDRAAELVPFNAEDLSAGPNPRDDDLPPRIVAVMPRRNDREIADEIYATMQRNDRARAEAEAYYRQAEPPQGDSAPVPGANTQVAQALRPWSPFGDGRTQADSGDGIWPVGWKDGKPPKQPKYPETDGVEGVLPPRGGSKSGQGAAEGQKPPQADSRPSQEEIPGAKPERHHVYPQQFRREFEKRGVDIDDPKHIREMPRDQHRGKETGVHSRGYNRRWEDFFENNPTSEANDLHNFGRKLDDEFKRKD